jgi:hypothetical protein
MSAECKYQKAPSRKTKQMLMEHTFKLYNRRRKTAGKQKEKIDEVKPFIASIILNGRPVCKNYLKTILWV